MLKAPTRTYEEYIDQIEHEISKRRVKWNLTALCWMDYDDMAQIIRLHIFRKWSQYDQSKPLGPWVNTIISNQIRNVIRNNFGNHARPCLKCTAAQGEDSCEIYGKQCSDCPLFEKWEKGRKHAYDVKLPVSLENHSQEVFEIAHNYVDMERSSSALHIKMEEILKPLEWRVYKYLYIDHLNEDEVAVKMGYKTSEQNRSPGYKQIKNIKKIILTKARKFLTSGDFDLI